jgi:hypothetical protein
MILFYGFLVLALFLLYADVRGLLIVAPERVRWRRRRRLRVSSSPLLLSVLLEKRHHQAMCGLGPPDEVDPRGKVPR